MVYPSPQDTIRTAPSGPAPQNTIRTTAQIGNSGEKLIDRDTISAIIETVGGQVKLFLPNYTVDSSGDTRLNYMPQPIIENALIRSRSDAVIVNDQGAQNQGDALGYFKFDSSVIPEAEVWVQRDPFEGTTLVYYVMSVQTSNFENERKFVKAVLSKRRYEPVYDGRM
jgi:hypothetical protein